MWQDCTSNLEEPRQPLLGVTQTCHKQRSLARHRNPVSSIMQFHNFGSKLSGNPGTVARPFPYIQTNGCMLVCMYIQLRIYERARVYVCVCATECVPEWPACPAYFVSWQHKRVAARCSVVFLSSNLRYCYNSAALRSFVRSLAFYLISFLCY